MANSIDAVESRCVQSASTWAPTALQPKGGRVNKQDLIAVVAEAGDLPKAKAGDIVDAMFEAIANSLKQKQDVRLVGFGTFSCSERKGGKGRNPRTGEEIDIPASTTVRFKPGQSLKAAVS